MKKIIPLLFILTSCASYIHTPQNRMISPEAQGKTFSGSIDLRLATTKQDRWSFTDNNPNKPFDGEAEVYKISGMIDLGLVNRLDFVYLDYLSGTTVGIYGMKIQLLGKTRDEAKKGNFSLSLFGGYGANKDSTNDDGDASQNWASNIEKLSYRIEHHDVGIIMGYRWADQLLQYVNAYYFHEKARGKVTTDGNILDEAKFKSTQNGMIYSTGAIQDLGANWFLKFDFSHMTSKWSSTRGSTSNAFNGGIGVHW